jgi:hypothetical protein
MNLYSPDLYMDIHVTDGADYQYTSPLVLGYKVLQVLLNGLILLIKLKLIKI